MNIQQMALLAACDPGFPVPQAPRRETVETLEQAAMFLFGKMREEAAQNEERRAAGELEYAFWLSELRNPAATNKGDA